MGRADSSHYRTIILLRGIIFLLLIVSLAQPSVTMEEHRTDWLFLVDHSDSMSLAMTEEARLWVREAWQKKADGDRIGVMGFGERNEWDIPFGESSVEEWPTSDVGGGETHLEHAIQAGLAEFDDERNSRMVLISDGNETLGRALNTINALIDNGIVLTAIVPPEEGGGSEMVLENVVLPDRLLEGDGYRADIVVTSNRGGAGEVRLFLDEKLIERFHVELNEGTNHFSVGLLAGSEGYHHFRAQISADGDVRPENNQLQRWVHVERPTRVLLVTHSSGYSRPLAEALHLQKLDTTLIPITGMPETLDEMLHYDVIIFDNVPGLNLTAEQMGAMHDFVYDHGGGFIMMGGDKSFGGGGYHDTPLEKMLPVDVDVEMPVEDASVALVLVIDRSDSMGTDVGLSTLGGSKLEIAKLASLAAIKLLKPTDQVGLVGFDTTSLWFVPMTTVSNTDQIADQLAEMHPGGGTDVYMGLRTAVQKLSEVEARKKHIIVLSDGLTRKRPFQDLIEKGVAENITLSTVGLGDMADHKLLKRLSTWGKGRYYLTNDPLKIPRIFTTETIIISRGMLEETEFTPTSVAEHEIFSGLSVAELPPLRGFVVTTAKPGAVVVLTASENSPLLVVRQYGLGRSVAFTSDLSTAWGKPWVHWPHYPKLVAQLVRWAAGGILDGQIELAVSFQGKTARVTADVFDRTGHFLNRVSVMGRLTFPDEQTQAIELRQESPGQYLGAFVLAGAGNYLLEVSGQRGGTRIGLKTMGFSVPYGQEYLPRKPNTAMLTELAEATGGVLWTGEQSVDVMSAVMGGAAAEPVPYPVWPYLVIAAALLYLLDIALRLFGWIFDMRKDPVESY